MRPSLCCLPKQFTLQLAFDNGDNPKTVEIVRALSSCTAEVDKLSRNRFPGVHTSPIRWVCNVCNRELVRMVVDANVDLKRLDERGRSWAWHLLDHATKKPELVLSLMELVGDKLTGDDAMQAPLVDALGHIGREALLPMVKRMIECGVSLDWPLRHDHREGETLRDRLRRHVQNGQAWREELGSLVSQECSLASTEREGRGAPTATAGAWVSGGAGASWTPPSARPHARHSSASACQGPRVPPGWVCLASCPAGGISAPSLFLLGGLRGARPRFSARKR